MWACACVCCMWVCVLRVGGYVHMCMHLGGVLRVCALRTCVHVCASMFSCVCICACMCVHVCVHVWTCVWACVCVFVCNV